MPNVVKVALDCETFGADGITVHPRPDERHIRRTDVFDLRPLLRTEFNIEGYPSPEFIDLVLKVKPHQVTLVPDSPTQLTSNAGWDTKANFNFLSEVLDGFNNAGIRTSVFVSTEPRPAPTGWNCIPSLMPRHMPRIRSRRWLLLWRLPKWRVSWAWA